MGNKIDLKSLQRATVASLKETNLNPENEVKVIVKVNEKGYVPSYVTLRAEISLELYTGTLKAKDLNALREDPKVVSVSVESQLHLE